MKKNTVGTHLASKNEKRSWIKRIDLFPRILCLLLALILWLTVVNLTDGKADGADRSTAPNTEQTA